MNEEKMTVEEMPKDVEETLKKIYEDKIGKIMLNKKISTAYKKCEQQLVEIQEEVVADTDIAMEERIQFVYFINQIKQNIINKYKSETIIKEIPTETEVLENA